MDAAEHLRAAEAFINTAPSPDAPDYSILDIAISVQALAHATIALAIESGVPHSTGSTGGGSGG